MGKDREDHTASVVITGPVTTEGRVECTIYGSVTIEGSVEITNAYITVDQKAGSTWTITGDVTVSSGTVEISGTVTITGDVNITNSVICIATSGGTNIVIDKLVQDAYVPRGGVTFSNDNGVTTPTAPPSERFDLFYGKLFSQGCVGVIEKVSIYVKNIHSGIPMPVTLAFSPSVRQTEIFSVVVTVPYGGTWGWYGVSVGRWWPYDKMFVYVRERGPYCYWGYEAVGVNLRDSFSASTELGYDTREFIRVSMYGLAVGYIPVGGTVNAIQIPNTVSSAGSITTKPIANELEEDLISTQYGTGKITMLVLYGTHVNCRFRVYCDGVIAVNEFLLHIGNLSLWQHSMASYPIMYVSPSAGNYRCYVFLELDFQKSYRVAGYQDSGSMQYMYAVATVTMVK